MIRNMFLHRIAKIKIINHCIGSTIWSIKVGDAYGKDNSIAILSFKSSLVVDPARKDLLLNPQSTPKRWMDDFIPGHIKYF